MNRYAITVNNWEQVDVTNLFGMPYDYIIVGFEQTSQGVPHLQVYLRLLKILSIYSGSCPGLT